MKILRTLSRIHVTPSALESAISFYQSLDQEQDTRRIHLPSLDLDLVQIGSFLILSSASDLPDAIRSTAITVLVDDLQAFHRHFRTTGTEILSPPTSVATGSQMRVRHPDGCVVEYVEHVAPLAEGPGT